MRGLKDQRASLDAPFHLQLLFRAEAPTSRLWPCGDGGWGSLVPEAEAGGDHDDHTTHKKHALDMHISASLTRQSAAGRTIFENTACYES